MVVGLNSEVKMNEKQKMLNGQWYDAANSKELADERLSCKTLCHEYNSLSPSQTEERKALLKKIIGKTGQSFHLEPSIWFDYGYNTELGENFYSNHNLVILDCAKVKFGNNVFIGPNCGFYTAIHPVCAEERNTGIESAKSITVGNNVWFGGNVTVLPGVKIGSNSTIGAGSVVVKDIPENVVAAGNPCRVIRQITEADKVLK